MMNKWYVLSVLIITSPLCAMEASNNIINYRPMLTEHEDYDQESVVITLRNDCTDMLVCCRSRNVTAGLLSFLGTTGVTCAGIGIAGLANAITLPLPVSLPLTIVGIGAGSFGFIGSIAQCMRIREIQEAQRLADEDILSD